MVQLQWNTVWWLLGDLKIDLPYDPAIPLLDVHHRELKWRSCSESCTRILTTALSTVAKMSKKLKYSLTYEQRKCGVLTYNVLFDLYKAVKYATTRVNLEDTELKKLVTYKQRSISEGWEHGAYHPGSPDNQWKTLSHKIKQRRNWRTFPINPWTLHVCRHTHTNTCIHYIHIHMTPQEKQTNTLWFYFYGVLRMIKFTENRKCFE